MQYTGKSLANVWKCVIINAAEQSSATLPYLSLADKYNTVFYKRCGAKLRYAAVFVLGGQIQYDIIGEDCEQELFPPVADRELFH